VLADTELADGQLRKVDAGGVPVLLYRTAGTVYALDSTCSHMGGPRGGHDQRRLRHLPMARQHLPVR
jgi:nitrite reductase/ring-hydroxylating ferredoxin subunit